MFVKFCKLTIKQKKALFFWQHLHKYWKKKKRSKTKYGQTLNPLYSPPPTRAPTGRWELAPSSCPPSMADTWTGKHTERNPASEKPNTGVSTKFVRVEDLIALGGARALSSSCLRHHHHHHHHRHHHHLPINPREVFVVRKKEFISSSHSPTTNTKLLHCSGYLCKLPGTADNCCCSFVCKIFRRLLM